MIASPCDHCVYNDFASEYRNGKLQEWSACAYNKPQFKKIQYPKQCSEYENEAKGND
jgi:hypothetical protein